MCTATYFPLEAGCLFGANRDEHINRKNALTPQLREFRNGQALYPVDGEKGGTWVGILENGLIACLLNGAFEPHEFNPPYRKSRGLIIPELFEYCDPRKFIDHVDLHQIEPFTLIMVPDSEGKSSITELRWDGSQKHVKSLNPQEPQLWASAPLNSPELIEKKKSRLTAWASEARNPNLEDLSVFHHEKDPEYPEQGVLMKSSKQVETVSVTLLERQSENARMVYEDLREGLKTEANLPLRLIPS